MVTGASGYVGGQVVGPLLRAGWRVRVLISSSQLANVAEHAWTREVEMMVGDVDSAHDLATVLPGVDVAYYLVPYTDPHHETALAAQTAERFAEAAHQAGVARIVCLSALHPSGSDLPPYLTALRDVAQALLDGPVPTVCLQPSVILGDGSASFQMLRYLTQRLPAMVAPRWLNNRIQPIAAEDLLRYLVAAALFPPEVNRAFDVGGPEVLTYADLVRRFAQITGLRERTVVTVPFLGSRVVEQWVGLITPLSAGVAKPLVGTLIHAAVCSEHDIAQHVPDPPGGLLGVDEAIRRAMLTVPVSSAARNLLQVGVATGTAALTGALISDPDALWYKRLDLPSWQPPPAAFPLVWGALYTDIIGTCSSVLTSFDDRDLREEAQSFRRALTVNLVLNAGWNAVFWRARRPWLAVATAAALTASSADLARRASQAGPRHRDMLVPYAAWCLFATALNAEAARRNPDPRSWGRRRSR